MDEAKAKFVSDWETVFPGVAIPNISILTASAESIENEIIKRTRVVKNLKSVLAQEEFVLEKLKGIKDVYSGLNNDDKSEDIVNEENKPTPTSENIVPNENIVENNKEKAEYKAIWDAVPKPVSVSEPDEEAVETNNSSTKNDHDETHKPIWESVPKPMNKLPSFGDEDLPPPPTPDEINISDSPVSTMDVHVEQGATFNIEVIKTNSDNISNQRDIARYGSGNSLSSFQSNSVGQNEDRKSLSQTSLNSMFLSESAFPDDDSVIIEPLDNFANIKTHRKSYSIDENVFDYSSPTPVARRLTDPLPNSQPRKEEKPKVAPRTMSRSKQHKPLPPLPKKPQRTLSVENDLNLVKNKPHSEPPKCPPPPLQQRSMSEISSCSSAYQDDEHIYTDISELNINRPRSPEAHESDSDNDGSPTEQIYENSNMQPKLEPLVDNSGKLEEKPIAQQRKRLGSHDRQGMALPDDVSVNTASRGSAASLEEILNGAQESSVDDAGSGYVNKPMITVNSKYDEDSSDDDEHIYANVDDLNLYSKGSDDDSDHDPLGDSISLGIPSPHYTELTAEQIQSMLHKIQNNTSDHSQGIPQQFSLAFLFFFLKKFKNGNVYVFILQYCIFFFFEYWFIKLSHTAKVS